MKSTNWSSRSAVDLRPNKRIASISNGVGPKGPVYGTSYTLSQAATSRPRSYHERNYRPHQNYDTMSLHSLRLADGMGSPGGVEDHYSIMSEQVDPLAQATLYKNRGGGGGGFSRSYTFERQMSAGSNAFPKGPVDWMDGVEPPQNRAVIRAPAMRTLQRFQSNNRSRFSTGSFSGSQGGVGNSYAGVLERSSRAPSVRSLTESNHHLQDLRAIDMYDGQNNTLMTQQSFSGG